MIRRPFLREDVAEWLHSVADLSEVNVQAVAYDFNLSESTLRRRLRERGTSLTKLIEAERKLRTQIAMTQWKIQGGDYLATLNGFESRASFYRAYKSWHGVSFKKSTQIIGTYK